MLALEGRTRKAWDLFAGGKTAILPGHDSVVDTSSEPDQYCPGWESLHGHARCRLSTALGLSAQFAIGSCASLCRNMKALGSSNKIDCFCATSLCNTTVDNTKVFSFHRKFQSAPLT